MYHTVIFVGNLGRDPEMRYTPTGKSVTSFNVAVSDGFGEHKKTIWFRVSAWEKTAEFCNQYLKKGSKVLVEGHLQADEQGNPRLWEGKDGEKRVSFEISAGIVRDLTAKVSSPDAATAEPAPEEYPF